MSAIALKVLLVPAVVVAASLLARRYGSAVGGLIGGLPVVAGPILLVLALEQGDGFAADAAAAATLGLVSLTAFVVTYGRLATRLPWFVALPAGWLGFAASTALLDRVEVGAAPALAIACAAFALGLAALPRAPSPGPTIARPPGWDLPMRALAGLALVLAVTGAASALGPRLSGLLTVFPVVVSVLSAFTHAQHGGAEVVALLRGLLVAFVGFAAFCFVLAISLPGLGTATAFAIASVAALATQAVVFAARRGASGAGAPV